MSGSGRLSIAVSLPLVLGAAGALSACRPPRPVETGVQEAPVVWPPPPEVSRVRYVRSLATAEDVAGRKTFFGRMLQLLTGTTDQRVRQPYGVAADSQGRIYVADPAAKLVHVFDPGRGKYTAIRGPKRDGFQYPVGVAVDDQNRLYVSDAEKRVVIGLDRDRNVFLTIADSLLRPAGLAFNPKNRLLYLADVLRHEVRAYDLRGNLAFSFGGRGPGPGQFNFPTNIAVDRQGAVYVTDAMNFRVQRFRPDGAFIASFGRLGDAIGDFAVPKGIGVDSEGHVYVVEGLYDAVNIFDREGRLLLTFGSAGAGRGEFWLATGLFVDRRDRIYVADSFNSRVQVFQYLSHAR